MSVVIVLSGEADREVTVNFTTFDGTARGELLSNEQLLSYT